MAYTTIDNPTAYFDTTLWSTQDTSIDTLNFQPDWVWLKSRSNADTHVAFDSVRGVNKRLSPSETSQESTTSDELTAFNSDGFTLGTGDNVNRASQTMVAWSWLSGGSASSNSDGSITSSVSANTTAGFSIVSYTGTGSNATVGHGLGVKPDWIINKTRDTTAQMWSVYHSSRGATKHLGLDRSNAEDTGSAYYQDTEPTSSVFSVGSEAATNYSSAALIAYCFAEKKGYSKFGSYTGNGNADGSFVYTGFKPAWLMIKRTDSGDGWLMIDNKRVGFNGGNNVLEADVNSAEDSGVADRQDILSNGFKLRSNWTKINASGGTYVYMAFAESPFVNSNGVPNNAR